MSDPMREPATRSRAAPAPPRSSRRKWFGAGADALVAVALIGGATLVLFLSWQKVRLHEQVSAKAVTIQNLEETLWRNIKVSALEGRPFPESLTERIHADINPSSAMHSSGLLVMAYTHTVCLRCLHEGLESLRNNRSLRERMSLHVLIAERTQTSRDRERALLLREDGLVPFPITFVPTDELFNSLFSHMGHDFAEEPIYLRLDRNFKIQSAFQADQRRPALLDDWLETIR